MFLMHKQSGSLVEILDISSLVDPCRPSLIGRFHAGEELQDPAKFSKEELTFPSGENLPRCWRDPAYKAI